MNLAVVLERPTQFDTPLFRHAALDSEHKLRVFYTDPQAARPAVDPELGLAVDWGTSLLAGYDSAVSPSRGRKSWLQRELASRRDLVVINGYTKYSFLIANASARRAGSPTALRLDSVLFDEGAGPKRAAKRFLFRLGVRRLFRLFLGVGTLTLEYLRDLGVPADRLGLFPYSVDTKGLRVAAAMTEGKRPVTRARLGVPANASVVIAVAKLHPRETPWDLLHAWPPNPPSNRWLLLAGDGPDRAAVHAYVADRHLPRVQLLGYVPYPELPALLAASDLFVHAPREERWGVTVAEALACGIPVVASDRVGAAHDLLRSGNGLRYQAGDLRALSCAIDAALYLPVSQVREVSNAILASWDVEATWRNLVDAAQCASSSAPK